MSINLLDKSKSEALIEAYQANIMHSTHPAFQFTYQSVKKSYDELADLTIDEWEFFKTHSCLSCGHFVDGTVHCEDCFIDMDGE